MASREPRYRLVRSSRRQRLLTGAVLVLGFIALGLTWPTLIRHVVIARIEAIAHRPVSIEAIHANPLTGRIDVQGLRLLDRDGQSPFADFERLIVSVRTLSMLFGHLSIRNLVLEGPTVRVVQLPDTFNLSDIIEHSAANSRVRDVTIDHFVLTKGAVTFEDRSVSLPRTWRSER